MLFNSLEFLVFFPVVTILFFALSHRFRWLLLLVSSCYFYMAFVPIYIVILGATIIIDYFAGIYIEQATGKRRKIYLIISLISNIGVLAVFKYFNFLNDNLSFLLSSIGQANPVPYLSILLPIGLSFHTFQAMSYTIEVYRGNQPAERHFGIYSLYVMFYPQLVAGPIERPQNVIHQFHEKQSFDYYRVADGLKLMAWGLFKKVVIADRLSILVNQVYSNPTEYQGLPLIIATVFFSFQIYCDFSGYSDIAIGSAQVMGFKLMTNFNRPYLARTIAEFWKRWHISLSTWFRDYLYIPLGGNRVAKWRWYYNLFIVFLVSGIWHGASWTFIIWGALHGFYQIFALVTVKQRAQFTHLIGLDKFPAINHALDVLATFILVAFAWIFFRANTTADAIYIATHMFTGLNLSSVSALRESLLGLGLDSTEMVIAVCAVLFMELVHRLQNRGSIRHMLSGRPAWVRWAVYNAIIIAIIFLGVFEKSSFIYFQF